MNGEKFTGHAIRPSPQTAQRAPRRYNHHPIKMAKTATTASSATEPGSEASTRKAGPVLPEDDVEAIGQALVGLDEDQSTWVGVWLSQLITVTPCTRLSLKVTKNMKLNDSDVCNL